MRAALLIALATCLALAHGYVETDSSPQNNDLRPQGAGFGTSLNMHNLVAAVLAGKFGPICTFEVEFATAGSKLGVTREMQATVIDIVVQGVDGVILCKTKTVTSHCYSISMHGVTVQGCLADLGLVCLSRKRIESCDDLDPLPIIGTTFPTQYGNATITKASVCGCVGEAPLTVYDLVNDQEAYQLTVAEQSDI
eukprot:evm.model.scf_605.2 EVM.evm.TU.scf_605.2   scf_605:66339-69797(-)